MLNVISGISLYRRPLYRGSTVVDKMARNFLTNHRAYLSQPITCKPLNTMLVIYPTDLPPEQWTELEMTLAATEN